MASRWLRILGIAVVAALFLSYAGAFGTIAAPLGVRLAYWLIAIGGGSLIGGAFYLLSLRVDALSDRPWLHVTVVTVVTSIPYTAAIWALTRMFFGAQAFEDAPSAVALARAFPSVLAVSAVMTALNVLALRRPVETHATAAGEPPSRFLDRLPDKLMGADLYAVQAEDHYLRLHTSRGSDLILMRLADALAELEGLEGAQTHRSWWVAKDAVTSARRGDGRAVLVLKSGAEAPVSRSYARALRQAGWF